MTISVRMDPLLEKELEMAAKRQGMTKTQFVIDAVERALGRKDPMALLHQVREEFAPYHSKVPQSSPALEPVKQRVRDAVRAKHMALQADWQAFHDEKAAQQTGKPK